MEGIGIGGVGARALTRIQTGLESRVAGGASGDESQKRLVISTPQTPAQVKPKSIATCAQVAYEKIIINFH